VKITICGAGNAAQTLVALVAGDATHEVVVYAPLGDEAAHLAAARAEPGLVAVFAGGGQRAGRPQQITADPASAGRDADLVLLALPAFAHEAVLAALAPHLPAHAAIGALPARGGFDWLVQAVLPGHAGIVFGLQTLPWACRIQEWGRRVQVLGVKAHVDLAAWPAGRAAETAATVGALIGVPLRPVRDFLALTLANTGQIIHPGIMYGIFHTWDGQPFAQDAVPLFYGGVDDATAAVLQAMSDEVQALCWTLGQHLPGLDLSSVAPLQTWLEEAYAGQIDDPRSLRAAFNTNRAYAGLRAPVEPAGESRCVPAFASRYLTEDVPDGLLVTRGIAELAGVATPVIDRVIGWAQARMGREYLVGGRVAGRDVARSRAPQRFGFESLAALMRPAPAPQQQAAGAAVV
jgi:hypothetical protein